MPAKAGRPGREASPSQRTSPCLSSDGRALGSGPVAAVSGRDRPSCPFPPRDKGTRPLASGEGRAEAEPEGLRRCTARMPVNSGDATFCRRRLMPLCLLLSYITPFILLHTRVSSQINLPGSSSAFDRDFI